MSNITSLLLASIILDFHHCVMVVEDSGNIGTAIVELVAYA